MNQMASPETESWLLEGSEEGRMNSEPSVSCSVYHPFVHSSTAIDVRLDSLHLFSSLSIIVSPP